jgi:hypothetical protein
MKIDNEECSVNRGPKKKIPVFVMQHKLSGWEIAINLYLKKLSTDG